MGSQSFVYTGAEQSFTVPVGVSAITVDMAGAQGGTDTNIGGLGGRLQGVLATTGGETLYVGVGGKGHDGDLAASGAGFAGGFYAGGAGGGSAGSGRGGSGGGQSYVKRGGTADSNRVLVAAGGGGNSQSGTSGQDVAAGFATEATAASAATAGAAGSSINHGGGGGGGGWVGGAGGALPGTTGAGGGSMAHSTQTSAVTATGAFRSGDGYVTFTWVDPGQTGNLAAGSITLVGQNMTATPGPITGNMQAGTATLVGQPMTATPGPVSATFASGVLTLVGQDATRTAGQQINFQAGVLHLNGQDMTRTPGPATRTLLAGLLTLVGQDASIRDVGPYVRPLVWDKALQRIRESSNTDMLSPTLVPAVAAAAPTLIAGGASYTVAEDTQVPTFSRCKVQGTLKIVGTLG